LNGLGDADTKEKKDQKEKTSEKKVIRGTEGGGKAVRRYKKKNGRVVKVRLRPQREGKKKTPEPYSTRSFSGEGW